MAGGACHLAMRFVESAQESDKPHFGIIPLHCRNAGRRQSATLMSRASRLRTRLRVWWSATWRATQPWTRPPDTAPASGREEGLREIEAGLALLPELLQGTSLPDGVVELAVEGARSPVRRLFDIHDGRITTLELGSAVPWASISGTASAWRLALGRERDVSQLWHTGDPHLAERVLAGLERLNLRSAEGGHEYSVLDCS